MLRLRIELLSPLCSSSGVGTPGFVDRDVVFGPEGLPLLPGRRIKGLWRDGWRQVEDTGSLPASSVERLFGHRGDEKPGLVRVGDAILEDAAAAGEWLRSLGERPSGAPFGREEVSAFYSTIRRQTAIDRKKGCALRDTLRSTRVLDPEAAPVFFASVADIPARRDILELAVAAAAIQQIGSGRNRGWGRVRCRLEAGSGKAWLDLTGEALAVLEAGRPWELGNGDAIPAAQPEPAAPADPGGVLHLQQFRIALAGPCLLPKLGGDAFTVLSSDSVPGSAIQGVLAARYLERFGKTSRDPGTRFQHLFCGGVRFLGAHPALASADQKPLAERRLAPLPHSVRRYKNDQANGQCVDLAVEEPRDNEALRRELGWTTIDGIWGGVAAAQVWPAMHIEYHHERATDRRRQHAMGQESKLVDRDAGERPGALFLYESLSAGQVFHGALLGTKEDLDLLRGLLVDGEAVALGRSLSAQYGKATWSWIGTPAPAAGQCEATGWGEPLAKQQSPKRIVVTLLSPLIAVNEHGHPTPEFPVEELKTRLGIESLDRADREFVRVEIVGGFLSHLRLPRQQMPAIAAGSVLVFSVPGGCDPAALIAAEQASYGLRTECGYGRVSIRPFPEEEIDEDFGPRPVGLARFRFETASSIPVVAQPGQPSGEAARLATGILRRQAMDLADSLATDVASHTRNWYCIYPHLLSRLAAMLEQSTLEEFANQVSPPKEYSGREQLRQPAIRQLRSALVEPIEGISGFLDRMRPNADRDKPLAAVFVQEFLAAGAKGWEDLYREVTGTAYRRHAAWIEQFPANPLLTSDDSQKRELVRAFLSRYLRVLARMHRKDRSPHLEGERHATR